MSDEKISVPNFYDGKSVFITGGSGALGKVLLEKLLRSCPGISCIYLLMRPKKKHSALERLSKLLDTPLFSKVREENPNVFKKIVLIEGNMNQPDLGISEVHIKLLINDVSIVFHSAAVVQFDQPLKDILSHNFFGTQKLLRLCCKMRKLEAFVYVSTMYSTCINPIIEECAPVIAELNGKVDFGCTDEEDFVNSIPADVANKWPNTYTFSKALTELLLYREHRTFPVAIVRPSIIISTLRDPVPGWIDNIHGPTLIILQRALGVHRSSVGVLNLIADLIPSDFVSNLLICAAWKIAREKLTEVQIYNCASGTRNPTIWKTFLLSCADRLKEYPPKGVLRYPHVRYYLKKSIFSSIMESLETYIFCLITGQFQVVPIQKQLSLIIKRFEWNTSQEWVVNDSNTILLHNGLSEKERETFLFDVKRINWDTFIKDYAIGIKRYILKEDMNDIGVLRSRLNSLYWREVILKLCILSAMTAFAYPKLLQYFWC